MSSLLQEELIPLTKAAKIVPKRRGEKPTHPSTLHRWARRGIRGIRLETLKAGGVVCTSHKAIERFFERLTAQHLEGRVPVSVARTAQVKEADRLAAEILA